MPLISGDATSNPKATSPFTIELIQCESHTFPLHVLVEFKYQETGDRLKPPEPSNGFQCEGSPFDKGHVCALELGGPDIPENIVPQWKVWQENGPWRRMESTNIRTHANNGDLFLCKVDWLLDLNFPGAPAKSNSATYLDYAAEELMQWDDYRIPLGFNIWVIKKGSEVYSALTADQSESDVANAFRLFTNNHTSLIRLRQEQMPKEDHLMHEGNQIRGAFREYEEVMEVAHQLNIENHAEQLRASSNLSSRQASVKATNEYGEFKKSELLHVFDDDHAALFREILQESYNYEPSESASLSTSRIINAVESSHRGNPAKRLRSQSEASQFRGLGVRNETKRDQRREKMAKKARDRKLKTRRKFT